jgi:protein-S-isoprenylcysteine O-methyltransferase Ste14
VGSLRKRLHPRLWVLYIFAAVLFVGADPTPRSLVAGAGLVLLGEALRLWATGHLNKNEALTVTGPYAFLRHPLYVGTLFIVAGFAVMASSSWSLALFGVFILFFFGYYMPYKSRIEGARLERLYGDDFRRYASAVPTLLPRLYPYRPLGAEQRATDSWQGQRFADNHEFGTAAAVVVAVGAMVARWALV